MEECQQSQPATDDNTAALVGVSRSQIENNKTFLCWPGPVWPGMANAKINFRGQFIISDIEWRVGGIMKHDSALSSPLALTKQNNNIHCTIRTVI